MKKLPDKLKRYLQKQKEIAEHRKRVLSKPVQDKRYIRGKINKIVKDAIFPRDTGDTTTDPMVRAAVLRKTGGICYICKRVFTYDTSLAAHVPHVYFSSLQIDHIVPLSKGGPNAISNYMPACSRCNRLKSNLDMQEALARIHRDIARRGY